MRRGWGGSCPKSNCTGSTKAPRPEYTPTSQKTWFLFWLYLHNIFTVASCKTAGIALSIQSAPSKTEKWFYGSMTNIKRAKLALLSCLLDSPSAGAISHQSSKCQDIPISRALSTVEFSEHYSLQLCDVFLGMCFILMCKQYWKLL